MDDATARVRKVWDDQAKSWYAERESLLADSRPVHEWLVRSVDPKPGERLLEIAAGPGDTGFLAAPLLERGRLVSTDIAPAMVEAAKKRGAELGITNAEYRVLDAQAMDLPDSVFDAAICRWGYMLMPDPASALRETRRVLKPRGRLALAVFTMPEENPWVAIPVGVLRSAGHLPAPGTDWQPGILALGNRDRLQKLLHDAGFSTSTIEAIDMAWTFASLDAYWTWLSDVTALGPVFRGLSEGDRVSVRAAIDKGVHSFVNAGRLSLPARCWGARAIR
jgi:ubiquinone/menaquinone biosynthesis C-methylase UbiE